MEGKQKYLQTSQKSLERMGTVSDQRGASWADEGASSNLGFPMLCRGKADIKRGNPKSPGHSPRPQDACSLFYVEGIQGVGRS